MSLIANVKDGQILTSASQTSLASSSKSSKSGTDAYSKDTFLQLLVAEVKNQDPLEPSTNTEWVSQYATFSELESMQNMSSSYDLSRASSLVGKTVTMKVTDSTGTTDTIQGAVDYVTYEDNKAYLSINGSLYSLEDLSNVVDTTYLNAYNKAYSWTSSFAKLPKLEDVTLSSKTSIQNLYDTYSSMSDYEKQFLSTDSVKGIKEYEEKLQTLIKESETT